MAEERQKILRERFSKRGKSEAGQETHQIKGKTVDRRRHSLYLDQGLVSRVDQAYKELAHDLYPAEIDKADFMEALLSFGLENLDQIKTKLAPQ
jgi:hypothetical protein